MQLAGKQPRWAGNKNKGSRRWSLQTWREIPFPITFVWTNRPNVVNLKMLPTIVCASVLRKHIHDFKRSALVWVLNLTQKAVILLKSLFPGSSSCRPGVQYLLLWERFPSGSETYHWGSYHQEHDVDRRQIWPSWGPGPMSLRGTSV